MTTPANIQIRAAQFGINGYNTITAPTEQVVSALHDAGYVVIPDLELPKITQDGNGKPKLPPLPNDPNDSAHGGRAGFHRLEAAQKLALADWYEKREVRDERQRLELMGNLLQWGIPSAEKVSHALIANGWHK